MFRRCLPAVFCAATLFSVALDAQTVQVEFVAPRDTMVALFGAANVSSGYTTGYRGIVIGPANVARFRAAAPPGADLRLPPARHPHAPHDRYAACGGGARTGRYPLPPDR